MAERNVHEPRPPLSRRQLIRRGMVAGGVALWSAPVVAAAAFSRKDARDAADRIRAQMAPGPSGSQAEGRLLTPGRLRRRCVDPAADRAAAPATRRAPASTSCAAVPTSPAATARVASTASATSTPPAPACAATTPTAPTWPRATRPTATATAPAGYFCIPTSCCSVPPGAPPRAAPSRRRPPRQAVATIPAPSSSRSCPRAR